jgi:hypothetical protein
VGALALALAFGLGGKDVAGDYLKKWLADEKTPAKTDGMQVRLIIT